MTLSQQNLKSTTEQTGATLFHRPPTLRQAPRFLTAVYNIVCNNSAVLSLVKSEAEMLSLMNRHHPRENFDETLQALPGIGFRTGCNGRFRFPGRFKESLGIIQRKSRLREQSVVEQRQFIPIPDRPEQQQQQFTLQQSDAPRKQPWRESHEQFAQRWIQKAES